MTMLTPIVVVLTLAFFISESVISAAPTSPSKTGQEIATEILAKHPVVDGHNDFAWYLKGNYNNQLQGLDFNSDLSSFAHTDLPRLRKGGVGGQFWAAYADCNTQYKDAPKVFQEQIDVIKRLVSKNKDNMVFVTSFAGLQKAFDDKKIGSMIGVESGHAIDSSLALLRILYSLGARYMTLTHNCNTPWADASQVDSKDPETKLAVRNNGLTDFGRKVIIEMNRMGMLVDLSHVSHKTMSDVLDVAKAPVIFSHSSAKALFDHPRNVQDDVLKRMPDNGGVVMVNFYDCFIAGCNNSTIDDVAQHIDHIKQVSGVDHVGLGSDFDGVPSLPEGIEDVSKFPDLVALLYDNYQWTPEELGKLTSGNLLRVWSKAEEVAAQMKNVVEDDSVLPEIDTYSNEGTCTSEWKT